MQSKNFESKLDSPDEIQVSPFAGSIIVNINFKGNCSQICQLGEIFVNGNFCVSVTQFVFSYHMNFLIVAGYEPDDLKNIQIVNS